MSQGKWITAFVAVVMGAVPMVPPSPPPPFADFNGDGQSDLAVWYPDIGIWRFGTVCEIDPQTECGFSHGHLTGSAPQAVTVPGDYDGDRHVDPAVFDPDSGLWCIVPLANGSPRRELWLGGPGDEPAPADYDGDGATDPAVWRASDGLWRWMNRPAERFGMRGDRPVPGDYDGDGSADVAVWRPADGVWYVQRSTGGYGFIAFGQSGDVPVPADYDGDRITDAAVFRPSTGQWWILRSGDGGHSAVTWGEHGDQLVPGDYNGDGTTEVAVYRRGIWLIHGHPAPIRFGAAHEMAVTAIR